MGKTPKIEHFEAKVTNLGNGGRKQIEIPKSVRDSFDAGKTVKVTIKELQ